jgi:exosome complex RNA-binding protein Csl4
MEEHVFPGTYLGSTSQYRSEEGTYVMNEGIYSSVSGTRKLIEETDKGLSINVFRKKTSVSVPKIGQIVFGKVIRVNPQYATILIFVADNRPCKVPYKGIIR